MSTDIETLKSVSDMVSNAGLSLTILVVLFSMYRFERQRVTELEEKRIEDHKQWNQMLSSILLQRGPTTNLGGGD